MPALLGGVRRLAAYAAVDGELDPSPIVAWAWHESVDVYLPRVTSGGRLTFAEHRPGGALEVGTLGIPAPPAGACTCEADHLDAVLVPLVAFDQSGTRAGTGAGYYDRTFAFRLADPRRMRPVLIGLAYAWQQVDHLERHPWDVPLDAVVTDAAVIRPGRPPAPR